MITLTPVTLDRMQELDPDQKKLRAEARRWSLKTTAATSRRNTAIAELHKAGVSYREIGRAVGLSHVAVRKIVTSAATADE